MAIVVDISDFSALSRITGVQRIVRDVLNAGWSSPDVFPVRYSVPDRGFVTVEGKPQLKQRASGRLVRSVGRLALAAAARIWRASARVLGGKSSSSVLNRAFNWIYANLLSGQSMAHSTAQASSVQVSPDFAWLLDVPRNPEHLNFLQDFLDKGGRLGVYLHDVIPTKMSACWQADLRAAQRDKFSKYLGLVERADKVICNSFFTRDEYLSISKREGRSRESVVVCYPPVSLQYFQTSSKTGAGLDGGADSATAHSLTLMAVAPLLRRKNLRVAFEATRLLARRTPQTLRFNLVCPLSQSIDSAAVARLRALKKEGLVEINEFYDLTDEALVSLYQQSDVVLVPSLYEGFGLPILEAIAAGSRVVASDIPVFRELRRKLEFELVDPHSPDAWATAIETHAKDKLVPGRARNVLPSPADFLSELRRLTPNS